MRTPTKYFLLSLPVVVLVNLMTTGMTIMFFEHRENKKEVRKRSILKDSSHNAFSEFISEKEDMTTTDVVSTVSSVTEISNHEVPSKTAVVPPVDQDSLRSEEEKFIVGGIKARVDTLAETSFTSFVKDKKTTGKTSWLSFFKRKEKNKEDTDEDNKKKE